MSEISFSAGSCSGSLITEMKVWCFRCVEGGRGSSQMTCCAVGTTGTQHLLFIWKKFFFFFRKITCWSFVGCILGLFGTTTPAKFILSHISDIPHSQPPLCLAYHLSLLLRWISFTTSWHTCLLVKMFALRLVLQLSLNFNEMLLDFFFWGGARIYGRMECE